MIIIGRKKTVFVMVLIFIFSIIGSVGIADNFQEINPLPDGENDIFINCKIDSNGNGNYIRYWPLVYFNIDEGIINISAANKDTVLLTSGAGALFFFFGDIFFNDGELEIHGKSLFCVLYG